MDLTDDQVRHLRRRAKEGESVAKLALEYGLSYMGAANIIAFKTRKKVGIAQKPHSLRALHPDLYGIWTMMHVRCTNPTHVSYKDYGGRGIKVCTEWQTFEGFYKDMYPRPSMNHTMDRKNANGDYTKDNVQWATKKAQGRNKRASLYLPHPITGEYIPAAEVAELYGICYQTMRYRLKKEGKWNPLTSTEVDALARPQESSSVVPPLSGDVQGNRHGSV
jgi:hypothetical protein